jgi:hypothetical protein
MQRIDPRRWRPLMARVILDLVVDLLYGSATNSSEAFSYHFGATAISEGIAFEMDQIVASGRKKSKNACRVDIRVLR